MAARVRRTSARGARAAARAAGAAARAGGASTRDTAGYARLQAGAGPRPGHRTGRARGTTPARRTGGWPRWVAIPVVLVVVAVAAVGGIGWYYSGQLLDVSHVPDPYDLRVTASGSGTVTLTRTAGLAASRRVRAGLAGRVRSAVRGGERRRTPKPDDSHPHAARRHASGRRPGAAGHRRLGSRRTRARPAGWPSPRSRCRTRSGRCRRGTSRARGRRGRSSCTAEAAAGRRGCASCRRCTGSGCRCSTSPTQRRRGAAQPRPPVPPRRLGVARRRGGRPLCPHPRSHRPRALRLVHGRRDRRGLPAAVDVRLGGEGRLYALLGAGTKKPDEHVLTPDRVVELLANGGLQVRGGRPAPPTSLAETWTARLRRR